MRILEPLSGSIFVAVAGKTPVVQCVAESGAETLTVNGVQAVKQDGKFVAEIPLEHLMIETDAPYLAPVPHRGKRCDSGLVYLVAEKIAQIKGISADEVARITTENGKRFFGIE